MTTPDPMAALTAAIDTTISTWGWIGLALLPVAAACVVAQRLAVAASRNPPPPPVFDNEAWRADGLALWAEFEKERPRG